VVENWNSANGFIFYGERGEFTTNEVDDQELGCSHCICCRSVWSTSTRSSSRKYSMSRVAKSDDGRGLARPHAVDLSHVNPYGRIELDMDTRLPLLRDPSKTLVLGRPGLTLRNAVESR